MLHVNQRAKILSLLKGYVPVAISVLMILGSFVIRDYGFRYTIRFSIQGLALFILFYNLFFTAKFRWAISILEWAPLAWFGTISYALYLWHVPMIDICVRYYGEQPISYVFALVLSLYLASFSYDMVEKRFLKLRKLFGSHGVIKTPISAT